jgi:hypothetical protein
MTNHAHSILTSGREDTLAVLLRRPHGRYAQSYNARHTRGGHAGSILRRTPPTL